MINELKHITIIFVLFQSTNKILNLIKKLSEFKIIIVDNGGNKEIIKKIINLNSQLQIITPKKNLGFGKANNLAFKFVNTKYTLLLNPDVSINKKAIIYLLNCIQNYNNCAIAVPNICDNICLKSEYGIFPEKSKGVKRNLIEQKISDSLDKKSPLGDICIDVAWGSAMLLNNNVIKKIGLFDENFFLYWEDIELCRRLREKKYSIIMSYKSYAVHYQHTSVKRNLISNFIINFHSEKSPFIYFKIKKNNPILYKRLFLYLLRSLSYLLVLNLNKSLKNTARFFAVFFYIFSRKQLIKHSKLKQ